MLLYHNGFLYVIQNLLHNLNAQIGACMVLFFTRHSQWHTHFLLQQFCHIVVEWSKIENALNCPHRSLGISVAIIIYSQKWQVCLFCRWISWLRVVPCIIQIPPPLYESSEAWHIKIRNKDLSSPPHTASICNKSHVAVVSLFKPWHLILWCFSFSCIFTVHVMLFTCITEITTLLHHL